MTSFRCFTSRLVAVTLVVAALVGFAPSASAQTALTSTRLAAAVTTGAQRVFSVSSASGIAAGGWLYVDLELVAVQSVSGTLITVRRGLGEGATSGVPHANGATVYVIPAGTAAGQAFVQVDPSGTCVSSNYPYLPLINTKNGLIWDCATMETPGSNTTGTSQYHWIAFGEALAHTAVPRSVVAGVAYTIKLSDYIVALTTTGTGAGQAVSVAVQTWTLPNAAGHYGKLLILKDESGGVGATTYVAFSGTIDGVFNVAAASLKTAYGAVMLYAGSGGWFTTGCWASGCR